MTATAVLAIVVLAAVSAWQATGLWRENNGEITAKNKATVITIGRTGSPDSQFDWQRSIDGLSADDPDGLSNIGQNVLGTLVGSYVAMKDAGTYTPSEGAKIAEAIAADLHADISFRMYGAKDITTDPKVSVLRMLAYRSDMRIALEPLLKSSTYELEVFGGYLQTKDVKYLTEFEGIIRNYKAATENVSRVIVPEDAAKYHVGVLNALSEFGATLEQMATYVNDPFASAALLRTFNSAEENMLTSFDALAGYFREHSRS